jgi:hypothetical protein
MKRRSIAWRLLVAFAGTAVALIVPATASAWIETTWDARDTSGSSGCVERMQHVTHGGANDAMNLRSSQHAGPGRVKLVSGVKKCDPNQYTFIRGRIYLGIVKMASEHSTSFSYCKELTKTSFNWVSKLEITTSYPAAPCGAGWYKLYTCSEVAGLSLLYPFPVTVSHGSVYDCGLPSSRWTWTPGGAHPLF